jgi:hypothetical protein
MGIDGISGGGMQGLQRAIGTPDLKQLQETGAKQDQEIKQLAELIKNAMASGANPEALKALMAQLAQLQQMATSSQDQGGGGIDAKGGGQGDGAAALDLARKLDEIKKQLEAIAQASGLEAGAQQTQQQQAQLAQQQAGAMARDRNMVQTPDRFGGY